MFDLQCAMCGLQFADYGLQVASCELQVVSCEGCVPARPKVLEVGKGAGLNDVVFHQF